MSIERMKDKPHGQPRKLPWRFRDRANGIVRYFKTKKEAEEFSEEHNGQKRRTGLGLPTTVKDLRRYKVRYVLQNYMHSRDFKTLADDDESYGDKEALEEAWESRGLPQNVFLALWRFSERDICEKTLFEFNRQVAEKYIQDRLNETVKPPGSISEEKRIQPSSVVWEKRHIQKAWKWAKNWPGLGQLENPWQDIRIPGSTGRRERSLEDDELAALLKHCDGCLEENRYYVRLVILLAAHTAMRRQEILNLTWEDIDFDKSRITIWKSKTDKATGNVGKPVKIVLPVMAEIVLIHLWCSLRDNGHPPGLERTLLAGANLGSVPSGKIFPKTGSAISQAFKDVARRAGIEDIQLSKDLRRTANTMFIQAGLRKEERDIMRRATNNSMDAVYIGREAMLKLIQDKLDKHVLGKSRRQAFADVEKEHKAVFALGLQKGLSDDEALELVREWHNQQLSRILPKREHQHDAA